MTLEEEAALRLLSAFEALGIPYAIGGSYASSVHGSARSTNDIDIVADLDARDCDRLAAALAADHYCDAEAGKDALARGTSFNIIHYDSGVKMDVFVVAADPLRLRLIARRVPRRYGERELPFISPEDTVLLKLDWYRMGGGVSDQQWRDVLGVLVAQSGRLDMGYLQGEAERMGLTELLEGALQEADEAAS